MGRAGNAHVRSIQGHAVDFWQACGNRSDWDSPLTEASFFLCVFSTLGNLGVMSSDRYLAVTRPMWYKTTVTMQHAIFACGGVWLTSISMVILRQVNVLPHKALEHVEGSFVVLFSCLVIAVQILTLVTLRKHNNAVAQVMEESARVNPATANNAVERQLTATTRHVVSLLALLIIPTAFSVGLSQILQVNAQYVCRAFVLSVCYSLLWYKPRVVLQRKYPN